MRNRFLMRCWSFTLLGHTAEEKNVLLNGIKIVSFCHFLQGPAGAQYLADMGADVIKVEPVLVF